MQTVAFKFNNIDICNEISLQIGVVTKNRSEQRCCIAVNTVNTVCCLCL